MTDRSYVLGTHDAEIARLGLQHDAWRPFVLDAWTRAGLRPGDTAADIGCGPGFATLDLATAVGPAGRVLALDRSARFLDHLRAQIADRGLTNVEILPRDVASEGVPSLDADLAWCRWVAAFVQDRHALVREIAAAVKPGGRVVFHEYFDYASWRCLPRTEGAALDRFVAQVIATWREAGGDPDVGAVIPGWLEDAGFEIESVRPLVHVVTPRDPLWPWLATFIRGGSDRVVELGAFTREEAAVLIAELDAAEAATPTARMVTPAVLETIARRPHGRQAERQEG